MELEEEDARELEVTVAVDVVVGGGLAAGAGAVRRGRVATRHAVDSRFFETLGSSLLLADCFFFLMKKSSRLVYMCHVWSLHIHKEPQSKHIYGSFRLFDGIS